MKNKTIIKRLLATVVIVALISTMAFSLASCKKEFNYNKAKLSKYVNVPEELYKSYNVTLDIPEITDFDVEEEVIKLLCEHKLEPDGPVYSIPGLTVSAGDVVRLYYRGYTEENGQKKYFDGGCNFADDPSKTELEIGSGTFIPGFESGLIGENGEGYATIDRVESGYVRLGDVISLTYSVIRAGGASQQNQTVLIDLADPTLDERWGEGFLTYIVGKSIGAEHKFATGNGEDKYLIVDSVNGDEGETDIYMNMTVSSASRVSEGEKLEIDVVFPKDYQDADLKGKPATFEVYIKSVRDYDVPAFDDAFITETLKLTAEDLSAFEGETLAAKYKEYIRSDLNERRDAKIKYAIEDAFWAQLIAGTEFKKLPESEVQKHYDIAINDLNEMFESYSSYYNNDFDAFVRSYLNLSSNADWKPIILKDAEESVKRRLAFYYIVREEEFEPGEEEYKEIYDRLFAGHLQEYLEYYNITEETENYEKRLEDAKKTVRESYGDEYWDESVLYEYFLAKIIDRAVVKNG